MAKRRKLGRALAGAAEGVSDVLGLLLQNKLIADRQEAIRQMWIDSQRISEEAATKRQLVGKALEDPEQAKRLSRSGLLGESRDFGEGVGGWREPDLSGLFRTEAEQEAPIRRKIGEASDLSKLPSIEDVIGLRAAEGPIETLPGLTGLLQQRGAKETALLGELPEHQEEGFDPQTGLKTRTTTSGAAQRRALSAGPVVTPLEPTPQQAGSQAAERAAAEVTTRNQLGVPLAEGQGEFTKWLANQGSPRRQAGEAAGAALTSGAQEDAKMTPGRVAARVGEAGRTTATQQANQLGPFEWVTTAQGQTMFRRPQASDVKFDEQAARGNMTPSMAAGVQRLKTSLKILTDLDPVLTQEPGIAGRVAGTEQKWWARLTGEDDPAVVYDATSESLLPALARSSGEVGNLAQQEQTRYSRLAPKVSDPINVRRAKYAAISYIIDNATTGASADDLRPFLDYMQFVQGGGRGTPPQGGDATDALLDELLGAGAR